jgi:O-acetylhomoserine/O-acetylserine sulfhydrylase-like pyridoxal-dependent enzyme
MLRRACGKALNALRLAKAAFTFEGGADYIAWKIERHSGVALELADWHRRHPLLAAPALLWRLRRRGAAR